jgi:hypothetical protein
MDLIKNIKSFACFFITIITFCELSKATEIESLLEHKTKKMLYSGFKKLSKEQSEVENSSTIHCIFEAILSCLSRFRFSSEPASCSNNKDLYLREKQASIKISKLPSDVILIITNFLNYRDQLILSHVNKNFRHIIDEDFWVNHIAKHRYLIWDASVPKAKVFFANYFYTKGFGRDPKLSERVFQKVDEITLLPNEYLAKKALLLGFPKGEENYRQVQHKKHTLLRGQSNKKGLKTMPEDLENKLLLKYSLFKR